MKAIDKDSFSTLAVYSVRYAMARHTGACFQVIHAIESNIESIIGYDLERIILEVERELELRKTVDRFDYLSWEHFLFNLQEEKNRRKQ